MATDTKVSTPPSVSWAQTNNRVFLTFNVECDKPDLKINDKSVTFTGVCAPDKNHHEVDIPLYAEVDIAKSMFENKGRYIEVVLAKKNTDDPFWPTLTSDKKKHHWLKVDFDKWQDEDESDVDVSDMNDMFSSKLGDFGDEEEVSSEEEAEFPSV